MIHRLASAFLLALILPLGAYTWQEGPYALVLDSTIDQRSAMVDREKYPDANAVVLEYAMSTRYKADGTYLQVADSAIKILTEKGVEEFRVVSSWYNRSYSRAKIPLVQLIKPDGTRINVDLKHNTSEMSENSDMAANIYDPQSRVIKVTVPGLAPGDILRCICVDETTRPRIPDSFSDLILFENENPIIHLAVTINAPESLPLNSIAVKDRQGAGLKHEVRRLNNRIVYTWEAADIPQYFSEPKMPPAAAYLQRLLVSTFKDWQEVSRWYWKLCEPHLKTTAAIEQEVRRLTQSCRDDREKAVAIFNFVSQKIRYMGVIAEDTAPGYEPHDVAKTFDDRAGVCRDKAALLVAMLRCAGLESFPVLIHTSAKRDPEVPMPYFNHAITAVRDRESGAITLMDPTNETTRDLLPSYLSDRSYLLATPEGDPLRTSPVQPAGNNLVEIRTSGELSGDGKLSIMSELVFNGINDNAYRMLMLNTPPADRRQFFEKLLRQRLPGCRINSIALAPADLQDMSRPFSVVLTAEAPEYLNDGGGDGNYATMRIPRLAGLFGMINFIFRDATLARRRFPYDTRFTCGTREEITLRLPDTLVPAAIPQYRSHDDELMLWQRRIGITSGALFFASAYSSRQVQYAPEQYGRVKEALRDFEAADRKQVVFRKIAPPAAKSGDDGGDGDGDPETPDAVIRNHQVTIELKDDHNWEYEELARIQVMSYNGVKENSDMSWEYNPLWDEIEILEARVINDGDVREIPAGMIHRMDADWAAAAPRYPAGKILVVNFPGVQPGSVIEYRLRRTMRNRPFFAFEGVLRSIYPADHIGYALMLPGSMKDAKPDFHPGGMLALVPKKDRPAVNASRERLDDGRMLYRWEIANARRIRVEDAMAPLNTFAPAIAFSRGNWRDYAAQIRDAVAPLLAADPAIASQAVALTANAADEEEKLVRIRDFIEQNIRRSAPDFCELPLDALTAPAVTLRDGYGNSADVALLYCAILRAAGFDKAELYLASALESPEMQELAAKYPTLRLFSKWLVRVQTASGNTVWLNDQSQYGQFGTCKYDHALLLRLKNGDLETLRLPPEFSNFTREKQEIRLDDDGNATVTVTTYVQGSQFGELKRHYAQMTAEQRRRHYQKLVADYSQNARPVTEDLRTDFIRYPGEISYTIQVDHFAQADGQFCYFTMNNPAATALGDARAQKRENPLYWSAFRQSEREIAITMPPSYRQPLLMPRKFSWRSPGGGTIDFRCRPVGKTAAGAAEYLFTTRSNLIPAIILPPQYPSLQEALKTLQHPSMNSVLLGR